jgi:hypothetical protein
MGEESMQTSRSGGFLFINFSPEERDEARERETGHPASDWFVSAGRGPSGIAKTRPRDSVKLHRKKALLACCASNLHVRSQQALGTPEMAAWSSLIGLPGAGGEMRRLASALSNAS